MRRSGENRELVLLSLFERDSPVAVVGQNRFPFGQNRPDCNAGVGQVVGVNRVFRFQRQVRFEIVSGEFPVGELVLGLKSDAPALVRSDGFFAANSGSFRKTIIFKTAVFNQFRIDSAVAGMVDFLKENAVHSRIERDALSSGVYGQGRRLSESASRHRRQRQYEHGKRFFHDVCVGLEGGSSVVSS